MLDKILGFIADWGITCIFSLLIGLCFDYPISLKIATGIWLILVFISYVYHFKFKS